jgi:hypothetical protein
MQTLATQSRGQNCPDAVEQSTPQIETLKNQIVAKMKLEDYLHWC